MFSFLKVGFSGSSIVDEGRVEGDKQNKTKYALTALLSLVSFTNLQRVESIPLSTPLIRILRSTSSKTWTPEGHHS